MKINFHPRGTSKTIIDKDLEAVDYFCINTVAYAAIPSCRPEIGRASCRERV